MQRQRGFTLIELLVVIAIIGILATLVVTQMGGARIRARNSTAQSDVAGIGKAIEVFKSEENAGDRVIGVTAAATLNNTTEGGQTVFLDLMAGKTFVDMDASPDDLNSTYAIGIKKSPSVAYTYNYSTSPVGTANGKLTDVSTGCYLVYTNIKSENGGSDTYFFARNGNTGVPATATATPTCSN